MTDLLFLALLGVLLWWSFRSINKTGREIHDLGEELEQSGFERQGQHYSVGLHDRAGWPYRWVPPRRDRESDPARNADDRRSWWVFVTVLGLAVSIPVVAVILALLA